MEPVRDCNSCHYSSWYRDGTGFGQCSAPIPEAHERGYTCCIQAKDPFTNCPAYKPKLPWTGKNYIDMG